MSEMVDRVAKSLGAVTTGPEAGEIVISEIFSADLWAMMSDRLARAAIEAMRSTPHDAWDSCEHVTGRDSEGYGISADEASTLWQWRIDAALTEKPRA